MQISKATAEEIFQYILTRETSLKVAADKFFQEVKKRFSEQSDQIDFITAELWEQDQGDFMLASAMGWTWEEMIDRFHELGVDGAHIIPRYVNHVIDWRGFHAGFDPEKWAL